jgi:hypothetical protein
MPIRISDCPTRLTICANCTGPGIAVGGVGGGAGAIIAGLAGAGAGSVSGFATESAASATGDAVIPLAAGGAGAAIAAGCEEATASPVMLGPVSRRSACAVCKFPLPVPDNVSFVLGLCEAALCELACALVPCVPAALEFARPEFVRWIAEAFSGVTSFGKANAADSVPGPAFEKNTENGVWLAIGNVVGESDPAAAVEVEAGVLWRPAAARTGMLFGAVVD